MSGLGWWGVHQPSNFGPLYTPSSGMVYVKLSSNGYGAYQITASINGGAAAGEFSQYSLSSSSSSVDEGGTVSIKIATRDLASGTSIPYKISGVSAADVEGNLSGISVFDASGFATVELTLSNDVFMEGDETLTFEAGGASITILVNDTSKSATYSLTNNWDSVDEGSTASFTLTTKYLAAGTAVPYTLSGVSAADVLGGLSGTAVVNSSGVATISVTLLNDNLTEGNETLTVTAGGASASTTVNDTSKKTIVTDVPTLVNVRGGKVFLSSTNPEEIVGTNKFDTVSSNLASHKARITKTSLGWSIQNNDDTQDTDTLVAVERVDFSNGQSHAFDVGTNGNAGKTAKMLTVLFGPQALNNPQYVGIGIATLDDGQTYQELITTALSVSGLASSDQLVSALYRNLTGYEGTAFQKKPYTDMLDSGAITSERLIELAGDAAMQIQTNLKDLANTGLAYKQSLPLPKPVSYELSSSAPSIDEGGIISISLLTKNLSAGTSVAYTVSGISADDLANASLSGNFVVDGSGLGQIALSVRADQQTEGPETLTLTAGTASIAVSINDVSLVGVSGGEGGGFGDGAGFGGGGGGD